jgi:hypothetical protein
MKKQTYIAFTILILSLVALIPFQHKKTFVIHTSYFITLQQITNPKNWLNWQPELREAVQKDAASTKIVHSGKTFSIKNKQIDYEIDPSAGFSISISKKLLGKNSITTWLVLPENLKGQTFITGFEKTNLIKLFYSYFSGDEYFTDILSLKKYLENDRLYYGFDIRRTTVTDSNVVVIKKTVPAKNKLLEAAKIRADLNTFIKKTN